MARLRMGQDNRWSFRTPPFIDSSFSDFTIFVLAHYLWDSEEFFHGSRRRYEEEGE